MRDIGSNSSHTNILCSETLNVNYQLLSQDSIHRKKSLCEIKKGIVPKLFDNFRRTYCRSAVHSSCMSIC